VITNVTEGSVMAGGISGAGAGAGSSSSIVTIGVPQETGSVTELGTQGGVVFNGVPVTAGVSTTGNSSVVNVTELGV